MSDCDLLLHRWRWKILESNLPSSTKLILLTLSIHMKGNGDDCFPSVRTIQKETSLSSRTVDRHLDLAVEREWLLKNIRDKSTKGWRRHMYFPSIPIEAMKKEERGINDHGVLPSATR